MLPRRCRYAEDSFSDQIVLLRVYEGWLQAKVPAVMLRCCAAYLPSISQARGRLAEREFCE